MASEPYLITSYTRCTLKDDESFPAPGTLIRLCLPRFINVPGSDPSSSQSSTSCTPEMPDLSGTHLAIVKDASSVDNGFIVAIYPIMSFSKHRQLPAADRVKRNPTLSPTDRFLLFPLPHLKQDLSLEAGWRQPETPEEFGEPLDCGRWINSRPAWLWASIQVFELAYGQRYFVPVPHVAVSSSELARIYSYIRARRRAFAQTVQEYIGRSAHRGGPSEPHSPSVRSSDKDNPSSSNHKLIPLENDGKNFPNDDDAWPTSEDEMELLDYLRSPDRNDLAAYYHSPSAENDRAYDSSRVTAWLEDIRRCSRIQLSAAVPT
ncbi:hypothetical protein Dda_1684 [Drechslerella dactyloides]|uniref:Uncharacterized protein n=1 Tax=Drechslerella dactyloides TaxID=74499 RepID=A0AAD6NLM8_DREDA|nr:hypothetical protein Dda_1684 [Drechslerella dactyloides]